jgi:RHS repeat-associated protein
MVMTCTAGEFTGKQRDTETGLDFFEARYLSSAQGRFTSTDPVIMAPHKVTDPQNWNLYAYARNNPLRFTDPTGEDIEEDIDKDFLKRYQKWKRDYLATAAGREQWAKYANDHNFLLKITVDKKHNEGAEAGNYQFDSNTGQLTGATITLGRNIGSGYPDSSDYPVTSSLKAGDISGTILAVTKFAHEFGHVNVTAAEGILHQQQDALIRQYGDLYNQLHSFADPRFSEIIQQLGSTPGALKTRERAAEANTIPYLRDRLPAKSMPSAVKQAIQNYEKGKP